MKATRAVRETPISFSLKQTAIVIATPMQMVKRFGGL